MKLTCTYLDTNSRKLPYLGSVEEGSNRQAYQSMFAAFKSSNS